MNLCAGITRSLPSCGLIAIVALAVALAAPSPCLGQTQLTLGQAATFDLFVTGPAGSVYTANSVIDGNVGLGANSSYGGSSTPIGGLVYQDNTTNVSYSSTGPVAGGAPVIGSLAQASADALSAASHASTWGTTTNANVLSTFSGSGNLQVNGSTANNGLNVVNFANTASIGANGVNTTITINGTSTEQFVFNFAKGVTLTETTIVLNGVSAQNVFFNIEGGSFSAIGASTINGNILNLSGGPMSIDNDVVNGAVISAGFVDMANSVIAPELPTIMMAGLAGLLVLGSAGLNQLRQRKLTRLSS